MILHRLVHDDLMQLLAINLARDFEASSRLLGWDCDNFIRTFRSLFWNALQVPNFVSASVQKLDH